MSTRLATFLAWLVICFGPEATDIEGNSPNAATPPACSIINPETVAGIQDQAVIRVSGDKHKRGGIPVSTCFFRTDSLARSVKLEFIHTGSRSEELWKQMFPHLGIAPADDTRESGENNPGSASVRPVSGLGREAAWLAAGRDATLYVRIYEVILTVHLGGGGDAVADDPLLRARALARHAIDVMARYRNIKTRAPAPDTRNGAPAGNLERDAASRRR